MPPRQLDQLPPDAATLARKVAALERDVREMRAARRMGTATVGRLRIYSADGQTLLAELGPTDDGGGGLQTRGNLGIDEIPVNASLTSGELNFKPVNSTLSNRPARVSYSVAPGFGSDLQFSSGAVGSSDWEAILDLGSVAGGGAPTVQISGFRETGGVGEFGACNMDLSGAFTAANIAFGQVTITPSAANTPTSTVVGGLNIAGSAFYGYASPVTGQPGFTSGTNGVTGVSVTGASSTGLTVWTTRQNTSATGVNWLVMGV